MSASWTDITAYSGHAHDPAGSIWHLRAGALQVIVEPYRGGDGGKFHPERPWRLQFDLSESDHPLKATDARAAQEEALALVRRALEAALVALPSPNKPKGDLS